MATLTAATQTDLQAGWVAFDSHSLGDTYAGEGFVEQGYGIQPDQAAGVAGWSGPTTRQSAGAIAGGYTTEHDLAGATETYTGPGYTETITPHNDPEPVGLGEWSGPTTRSSAGAIAGGYTTEHDLAGATETYISAGFPDQEAYGIQPDRAAGRGAIIPTSYFRRATGRALDRNGNPIPNGLYVLALDNFSTAGPVDEEGRFEIYLLRQDYSRFVLVGEAPGENAGYDLVWYELESNPNLPVYKDSIELRFNVENPQAGSPEKMRSLGLSIGSGVHIG